MKAVNIMWDTDEDIVDGSLPDKVEIPNGIDEEDVADYLSDTFGFCVFGFDIEKECEPMTIETMEYDDGIAHGVQVVILVSSMEQIKYCF